MKNRKIIMKKEMLFFEKILSSRQLLAVIGEQNSNLSHGFKLELIIRYYL